MTLPARAAALRGDDFQHVIGFYWAYQALCDPTSSPSASKTHMAAPSTTSSSSASPAPPKVSPSRIKSDLRRSHFDVTVEQVAWVMVTVMRAPEVTPPPRSRPRRRNRALRWLGRTRD